MTKFRLFLDCDGVLANFEKEFINYTGYSVERYSKIYGEYSYWKVIEEHPDFFGSLELMPDAIQLYEAVAHLNPPILTGASNRQWAHDQKQRWKSINFPETEMIVTRSSTKYLFREWDCVNILVDDWPKHRALWETDDNIFIEHISSEDTIKKLKEIGCLT